MTEWVDVVALPTNKFGLKLKPAGYWIMESLLGYHCRPSKLPSLLIHFPVPPPDKDELSLNLL
jgi:hypothetical protein